MTDITKHKWSDEAIEFQGTGNNHLSLAAANDEEHCWSHFCILKQDAIAIAKHFKLTEGDLNGSNLLD